MGRKARRKIDRRSGERPLTTKERERAAWKADLRGRQLGNSLAEYERAASVGSKRVREALIARHNVRMSNLPELPEQFRFVVLNALAPVPMLDLMLSKYGADSTRAPASYAGGWVDQLAWGLDSAVSAVRLLLAGQFVGAALVSRHQMERWTNHRAFNTDTRRVKGESSADFVARVWASATVDHFGIVNQVSADDELRIIGEEVADSSAAPMSPTGEPEADHEHVVLSDGTEVCPAGAFAVLCDVLHGHAGIRALEWDVLEKCNPETLPPEAFGLAEAVADVVSLNLRQIRAALAFYAAERKDPWTMAQLRVMPDRFTEVSSSANVPENPAGDAGAEGYLSSFKAQVPMPDKTVWPGLWELAPLHPVHGMRNTAVRDIEAKASYFDAVLAGAAPVRTTLQR